METNENKEQKNIPVMEYILNEDNEGLFTISLVNEPAILVDFLKFNKQTAIEQFKTISEDKRLVTGAVMIPGMRIYRQDPEIGEYYGYFSADTIKQLVYNYFKNEKINSFNIEHDPKGNITGKGVYMVESWFTTETDKSKELGFNLPVGSWFVTLRIEDDKIWNEYVRSGLVNGFSVEVAIDAISKFSKEVCPITKQMVQVAKLKKALIENDLKEFILSNNTKTINAEYWNKQCRCANCIELKGLGVNLPNVLPDFKEYIKIISVS